MSRYNRECISPPADDLVADTRQFFLNPRVMRCSKSMVDLVKGRFEDTLTEATSNYSEGKINSAQFVDTIRDEIDPLRKTYEFWKARYSPVLDYTLDF
ncbi:hypothetical protein COU60_03400 [Candidatus Pacearchaeota archaeon CG10_big_fil_rev_8_21_14_0_10_34_76]|nr:MAG: hypothetical protein COU60_03400 [Candidatus Pacearchaeota archaeon CG10_big_fil_rev_8_21_14_0_10_34_76]